MRWGETFWQAVNATWPFATLTASTDAIHVSLRFIGLMKEDFDFQKAEITGIRKRKGVLPFSTGIVIEHQKPDTPRFILFWTFGYTRLKSELTRLGFTVLDA